MFSSSRFRFKKNCMMVNCVVTNGRLACHDILTLCFVNIIVIGGIFLNLLTCMGIHDIVYF